jgi:hypothetical protein
VRGRRRTGLEHRRYRNEAWLSRKSCGASALRGSRSRYVPTLAQERYLGSYRARQPCTTPPAQSDETPWLLIALSLTGALAIVAATATQRRRVRVRRRRAASPAA